MLSNDPASYSHTAGPPGVVMGLFCCFPSGVRAPADQASLIATTALLEGEVVGVDTGMGVPGIRAVPWGMGLG